MEIQIREYQEGDRPFITKCLEDLHDYITDIDPDKRLRRQPEFGQVFTDELLLFVKKGNGKIYIAVDGDVLIGFSGGAIDKKSKKDLLEVKPSKVGVISDVVVEEKYRGRGIGKMLIEKLEKYFKSQDCDTIWLSVIAFNPAHDMYLKLGYRDREIGMLKKI